MADHHTGEAGGYRCPGYAAVGHTAGTGSDRNTDRGYCAAASQLCSADGAGIHPPAAGGGDRRGKGKGGAFRQTGDGAAGGILERIGALAGGGTVRAGCRQTAGCIAPHIPQMGRGEKGGKFVKKSILLCLLSVFKNVAGG